VPRGSRRCLQHEAVWLALMARVAPHAPRELPPVGCPQAPCCVACCRLTRCETGRAHAHSAACGELVPPALHCATMYGSIPRRTRRTLTRAAKQTPLRPLCRG
jgi:hypothetical protein